MAWVPWVTGNPVTAVHLNQMTRCVGTWNAAGNEIFLPASAFHPAMQYGACKPHTWYVTPSGGDWLTLPMDPVNGRGAAVGIVVPKQWNGMLQTRTWYFDMGGGGSYATVVVMGTSGDGEQLGGSHMTVVAPVLPATGTQYGLYVSNWSGFVSPGATAGDLLWVLVHRWGFAAEDTATSDWPFVGLSLSFQCSAVNDA